MNVRLDRGSGGLSAVGAAAPAPALRWLVPLRQMAVAVLAGALPALVTGVLMRAAMRVAAVLDHVPTGFSWGGTAFIILVTVTILGFSSGVLLLAIGRFLPRATWLRALVYGTVLLGLLGIPFAIGGPEGVNNGETALAKQAIFASLFLVQGVGTVLAWPWMERRLPAGNRRPRAAVVGYGLLSLLGLAGVEELIRTAISMAMH